MPEPKIIVGTVGADNLVGTVGNDTIWGEPSLTGTTGGNDVLRGGKGDDYLSGGVGSDTYVAERDGGVDTIRWFEAGKDKLDVSLFGWKSLAEMQAADVTMKSGTDANGMPLVTVDFGSGDAFKVTGVSGLAAGDFLFASSGTPAPEPADISGTSGKDVLKGTAGAETIDGKAGDDRLYALSGDDTLLGGAGNDLLSGAAGNDRLDGGTGSDLLLGGTGNDTFVFGRGFGQDSVLDFTDGSDKIDLSAFGLGGMAELSKAATVTEGTHEVYIDFGNGDRLSVFGLSALTQANVIF